MTDFKQQVGVVNKHYRLHRIKCVLLSVFVFVFVFHRTKHGNIVLEQGLREKFGLWKERLAGGYTKFHSEELRVLYWSLNGGGG
jgi:hypothetical protein